MSKICKKCGAEISDAAIICMHCNSFCDDDAVDITEETVVPDDEKKEEQSVVDLPGIVFEDFDDLFEEKNDEKVEAVEEESDPVASEEVNSEENSEEKSDEKTEETFEENTEEKNEETAEVPNKKKEIPATILIVAAMAVVSLLLVAIMITGAFKKKATILKDAETLAEQVRAENEAIEEAERQAEEARLAELAAISENEIKAAQNSDKDSDKKDEEEEDDSEEQSKKDAEDKAKKESATIKMTEEEFVYAWYNDQYLEMLPILVGGTPINIISGDDYSCATFEGVSGPYAKDYVENQVKKCGFEIDAVSKEKASDADYVFYANSDDKRTYFVQVDVADKKCHVTVGSAQKSKESN